MNRISTSLQAVANAELHATLVEALSFQSKLGVQRIFTLGSALSNGWSGSQKNRN